MTCEPPVQRARLLGRGSSADDATQRIAAQDGVAERVRRVAARVIDTSGDPATTRRAVESAAAEVLRPG